MRVTEEEAQLILAAVLYMTDEQAEWAKSSSERGFKPKAEYFKKMYHKYNNLYKKLCNELADITE